MWLSSDVGDGAAQHPDRPARDPNRAAPDAHGHAGRDRHAHTNRWPCDSNGYAGPMTTTSSYPTPVVPAPMGRANAMPKRSPQARG